MARILYSNQLAGYVEKIDDSPYTMTSRILFSFFDGLIPEGWLLNIASSHWKIDRTNRFELLITLCRDTIGAVTVEPVEQKAAHG